MGSERGRPSADLPRLAGTESTTTARDFEALGAVLDRLVDPEAADLSAAIDRAEMQAQLARERGWLTVAIGFEQLRAELAGLALR